MLRALRKRISGTASPGLRIAAEDDINANFKRLICSALQKWSDEHFSKFSAHELSYSVRLFYFCEVVLEEHQDDFPIAHILHDALQPSREMLLGLIHPSSSPRPDFTVTIGAVKFRVEAKRLKASNGLPALYVRQGMTRFISGRYRSTRPFPGIMIGYIEADTVEQAIDQVNEVINCEPELGESHRLSAIQGAVDQLPELSIYESKHNDLLIHHYAIDVRS